MGELADLRAARGRWCFPEGHRWLRIERIKYLEAIENMAAAEEESTADIEGSDEANDAETTTDEA